MHPLIAYDLAKIKVRDLDAEAERERLVASARPVRRKQADSEPAIPVRWALRRFFAKLHWADSGRLTTAAWGVRLVGRRTPRRSATYAICADRYYRMANPAWDCNLRLAKVAGRIRSDWSNLSSTTTAEADSSLRPSRSGGHARPVDRPRSPASRSPSS